MAGKGGFNNIGANLGKSNIGNMGSMEMNHLYMN
jgi:hypothetical protein